MNNLPFVSIIIPCRNEEKHIGKCLDSVVSQDYPKENLEVLVVNGASEDKTKKIIEDYAKKHSFIKLSENSKKFTPFGLNIGIKAAKGEIVARMDAHAGYPKDYISKCVKFLKESGADNVGGVVKTSPAENTLAARAIAFCLSHPFGVGGSYFRLGSKAPRLVDTVFGGCYKREVFDKIGYYNEKLIRSQDIEFNQRLKKAGGKILLTPEIVVNYYPKSTLSDFLNHNFQDGIWTTYPLKFGIRVFSFRHLIPLIFVLSSLAILILGIFYPIFGQIFIFGALLYAALNIYFSAGIAFGEKDLRYLFLMPLVFGIRQFGYGLGSIFGLIKILKD